ncbi:GLPGLI family protein [Prevotella sp. 10(H)]|uniref:GLPGLI family protein n=1 Tax=Prevotella sp. 10(H) TaxID=1158294 RepID=UPI0004A6F102|nr:GLPGLI family protein [Prevotella sp. 10(H)]
MKKALLLITLSTVSLITSAQVVVAAGRKDDGSKQEKLDAATIRCYYKFTQPVTVDKETIQVRDTMTLDIGGKVSKYYDASREKRDSLLTDFMTNKMDINTIQSVTVLKEADPSAFDGSAGTTFDGTSRGETAKLYKKRQAGQMITTDNAENGPEKYKCTESVPAQKWNITTDTLTVLNYLCQKATTSFRGRNYEVWFSPDIPVNDGPWKLYGLPGLILKANDTENLFSFEIIGLENLASPVEINLPMADYIKASVKDLEKLKRKRSGGTAINVNGGNVVIVNKKNENQYQPLEIE